MFEFPCWRDLVNGNDLVRMRHEGLEACLRGDQGATSRVLLRTKTRWIDLPVWTEVAITGRLESLPADHTQERTQLELLRTLAGILLQEQHEATVTLDIYDLRSLIGLRLREFPLPSEAFRHMRTRWSSALTIDELRTRIRADLPELVEIMKGPEENSPLESKPCTT